MGDGVQKAHYEQYADDPVLQHKNAKVIPTSMFTLAAPTRRCAELASHLSSSRQPSPLRSPVSSWLPPTPPHNNFAA